MTTTRKPDEDQKIELEDDGKIDESSETEQNIENFVQYFFWGSLITVLVIALVKAITGG